MKRVLVACEFSGVVRRAFRARGFEAWSCDLLQAEDSQDFHVRGDIFEFLKICPYWDLMIAHPPCQYLCPSGIHWNERVPGRNSKTEDAASFFLKLANADIKCIAIENSVGIMSTVYRKPDQIIQPWQFGHPESKATCLWLKGLPKLDPTNILQKPSCGYWDNQTKSHQNKIGPSVNRWKDRSRTYAGIADAMADQWGKVLED
jgi:hypothetical protein